MGYIVGLSYLLWACIKNAFFWSVDLCLLWPIDSSNISKALEYWLPTQKKTLALTVAHLGGARNVHDAVMSDDNWIFNEVFCGLVSIIDIM